MLFPNVGIENGKYGKFNLDKEGNQFHEPLGNAVRIKRKYKDLETGEIKFKLEYEYSDELRTVDISRGQLQKSKLLELAKNGVDVFEDTALVLAKELRNQEEEIRLEHIHHNLGWGVIETKKGKLVVFKTSTIDEINSTYVGEINVESKGSYDEWIKMVKTHVLGYIPMEIALIVGLSAVVHGYIAVEIKSDNIIIHFIGDSSTGKTTSGQLAISVGGFPEIKSNNGTSNNRLITNWGGTPNAILKHVAGNNGLPVMYDELNLCKINDLTDIVYSFASGKDRDRLNKDLSMRENPSFCTTIISTGEKALLSKCNKNTGLKVRVLEFRNIQWTKSSKHSEQIADTILNNYGHSSNILAKYLKSLDKNDVIATWSDWRNKYIASVPEKDKFTEKMSKQFATLLLTADLANKALEINLDLDGILDFLISNTGYENRNIAVEAYEHLLEQVAVHQDKFGLKKESKIDGTQYLDNGREIWGIEEELPTPFFLPTGEKCERQIVIVPSSFRKIMSDGGFDEEKIILAKFKEKGLLVHDKNCLTRKRRLVRGGNDIRTYVIKVISEEEDDVQITPPKPLKKPRAIKPGESFL